MTRVPERFSAHQSPRPTGSIALGAVLVVASLLMFAVTAGIDFEPQLAVIALLSAGGLALIGQTIMAMRRGALSAEAEERQDDSAL